MTPASKLPGVSPKVFAGSKKVSMALLPGIAIAHGAHAMMDGADKYGPFNWRARPVPASVYVNACLRHVEAWFDGEETAEDSGVHHLGHAIGCLAILLDAQETGSLIDDRPINKKCRGAFARALAKLNQKLKGKLVPKR
jgi:Domain of unknown function (DUF5664)